VSGTSVTTTTGNDAYDTLGYCVSGSTLTLIDNVPGSNAVLVLTRALPSG
jgi:hypothetical protein